MTADEYVRQKYNIPATAVSYKSDIGGPGGHMSFSLAQDHETGEPLIRAELRRSEIAIHWVEYLKTQEDWERVIEMLRKNPETR